MADWTNAQQTYPASKKLKERMPLSFRILGSNAYNIIPSHDFG